MKLSSRGRYGVAALIVIAQNSSSSEVTAVVSIAEKLGISKIYLEQIFSLLKRSELVNAVKGSQGGYRLTRPASDITALDMLMALEHALFEQNEASTLEGAPEIEQVMHEHVFSALDHAISDVLQKVTLAELAAQVDALTSDGSYMFYI